MEAMTAHRRIRTATLAAAAVLALPVLAGCGQDDEPRADDPTPVDASPSASEPTDEPTASAPTEQSSPSAPESSDSSEAGSTTVPVYLLGDTPVGPRLFREFRSVPDGDPLAEAAALVTDGDPLDPDYRSPFPNDGTFASVTAEDDDLVVELPDASWTERPDGMSRRQARLAVQALVYTLQGVQQERLPRRTVLEGEPASLFGLNTGGGVREAPQLDVLALMNVTSPEEGATVHDTFTASGVASSFEATVLWEVRNGSGKVVKRGFTTAEGWIDKLYPWEAEVDLTSLRPGRYTFAAITDDPSGGEGPGPTEDTKTIVLERSR